MTQMAPLKAYHAPTSLDECLQIMAKEGSRLIVIAGGQSVMPLLKTRGLRPEALLDLVHVGELHGLDVLDADGSLLVGAMCRHRELWSDPAVAGGWPALADAAAGVGDRQIQNRGTIGGNLAFGTVITDMKQVAMCLDAELHIAGPEGERKVGALELFADAERMLLQPGELLKAVCFPPAGKGGGSAYRKYGITANGRPVIGVAAAVTLDEAGLCADARIVVGGLVPCPNIAKYAAQSLIGKKVDTQGIAAAADAAAEEIKPQSDSRATSAYRRQLVRVYGRQVLELAFERAQEDLSRWNS
ncbi:FAD binding domain-containing protein [Rhizorhapis sp.]|uniref:FAD binding domain-containing protein n=1 Tax=Rhizorhapis sp. TaxID=1968842 RepID=UPI002B45C4B3|nr:FAD binding domain-containing protein [Rhizorhapis sp.]HKR17920.1 FAD binding domain-containing protein [Rhizorhapis sp.]